MKLNIRKFMQYYAVFLIMLFCAGCSAAWLGAVSALLPALEAAVGAAISFVLALEGKTVPPAVAAAIKKIGDDIATEISNVQALIAAYKSSASTGLLSQIQAVFNAIGANLASILTGLNVTDSSTVSKITQLVALATAAVQAILALVPMVIVKLESGASPEELGREDKIASAAVQVTTKTLKETYVSIVSEYTENPDVNAALDSLPRSI